MELEAQMATPTDAAASGAPQRSRTPEASQADLEAIQSLLRASGSAGEPLELRSWLELAEAWYIARTLRALRGNRSAAARALGIGRRTLYAKMQKLGIEASWQPGRRA